jgi:hypothetical protein
MLVAIHQPNFFPWLGYFNKIARADVFCLLDNVQMPKTGGSYINRVQLLLGNRPTWVTAPIQRNYSGFLPIADIIFDERQPWRQKFLKTLQTVFGQTPHFRAVYSFLEPLVLYPEEKVARYNEHAIRELCAALKLTHCRLVRGSDLPVQGKATDLLIQIVQAVGGDAYLCGGGAAGYQEDEKFAHAGIRLIYQNFQHPVYQQGKRTDFTPGLSIIDCLMHCGFTETARLIGAI